MLCRIQQFHHLRHRLGAESAVGWGGEGRTRIAPSGVPEDAVLTGIGRGYTATDITLYVASAAFEPLEPGQPPPEHPLTFDMRE